MTAVIHNEAAIDGTLILPILRRLAAKLPSNLTLAAYKDQSLPRPHIVACIIGITPGIGADTYEIRLQVDAGAYTECDAIMRRLLCSLPQITGAQGPETQDGGNFTAEVALKV